MNRNEQRTAETKKNLQEAFLKLYEKKDISQITIREITDLAGYNQSNESKLWQRDYIMEYHFPPSSPSCAAGSKMDKKSPWKSFWIFCSRFPSRDPSPCCLNVFIKLSLKPADKTVHGCCNTKTACHGPSAAAWSADPIQDTACAAPCCLPSKAPRT